MYRSEQEFDGRRHLRLDDEDREWRGRQPARSSSTMPLMTSSGM